MTNVVSTEFINPGSLQFDYVRVIPHNTTEQEPLDITNLVVQLDIYESMYEPFIKGSLLVVDSLSLISTLPMIGDETLELRAFIPHPYFVNDPIEFTARIVAVRDMTIANMRTASYTIEFVSKEMISNISRRVRKGWINTPISDMARDIYDLYLKETFQGKPFEVDPTLGLRTLVVPNMHPAVALAMLAHEAKSDSIRTDDNGTEIFTGFDSKTSNYIFYEDLKGFHFKTLDGIMYKNKLKIGQTNELLQFFLRDQNLLQDKQRENTNWRMSSFTNMPMDWAKIIDYKFLHFYDRVREIKSGKFENKVLIIDPIKQVYRESTLTHEIGFEDGIEQISNGVGLRTTHSDSVFMKLNQDPRNIGDSHIRMVLAREDHNDGIPANQRPDFLNHLIMSFAQLNSVMLNMTVPGNTKIRPGEIIAVNFPEFGGTDDVLGKSHRLLSRGKDAPGYFLVTYVRHVYNKSGGYNLSLELVKNAYEQPLEPLRAGGV